MRKFYAIAALAIIAACLAAPFAFAQEPGTEPPPTVDVQTLIIMGATSLAGFFVGAAIKKWPALDFYSNRLIPYTNVVLITVAYMVFRDLDFERALLEAGATALGSVLLAEGPLKKLSGKAVGTGALVLATLAFPSGASAQESESKLLQPRWAGPVNATFTNAGPDSVLGPRARIEVPIVVALTNPVTIKGYNVSLEAQFKWTTKAYLGEESEPLQDASYGWFPHIRIEPVDPGFLQWIKVGPPHVSNGADGTESRSMNAGGAEVALAYKAFGITFDAYASVWYTYDYGSNTESIADVISLVDDVGAKVIVRGSVDMLQLAVELGPEWQKYLTFIPLADFYNVGLFGEFHNGKFEGLLEYGSSEQTAYMGFSLTPPLPQI